MINFDLPSYVTYNILTPSEKIQFFFDVITNGLTDAASELYHAKFKEFQRGQTSQAIGVITYLYKNKYRVNIIYDGEYAHVNSNSIKAIEDVIRKVFNIGDIVYSQPTSERPKVCHLKHYKKYRKINPPNTQYPIFYS